MSDALIVAERFALATGTGTADYIIDRLLDRVPKAIVVISPSSINEGSETTDVEFTYGAADAVAEWCVNGTSADGLGTTHTKKIFSTTSVLFTLDADDPINSSAKDDFRFDSFIAGGVRLDGIVASGNARVITIVFFFGEDLQVDVGTIDVTTSPQGITGVGFKPDALLLASVMGRRINDDQDGSDISIGFVSEDVAGTIDQACFAHRDADGLGTSDGRARVSESAALIGVDAGNNFFDFDIDSMDDDGFTISRAQTIQQRIGYLAIRGRPFGMRMKAFGFDSPTSTGVQAYTEPGFEPQMVLAVGTIVDTLDTTKSDSQVESFCVSAIDKTYSRAVTQMYVDGDPTSDVEDVNIQRALFLRNADATVFIDADYISMDATGFSLDYATVQGSARKQIGLAFEMPQKPMGAEDLSQAQTDLNNALDANLADGTRPEKLVSMRLDPEGHPSSWIVLYSARMSYSAAGRASFEVRVDGTAKSANARTAEDAANEFANFSGFVVLEDIETPRDVSLWVNGSSGIAGRWGRLVAFRLDVPSSDFGSDEIDGNLAITGTTFQDLASVSITPATAGDYLVLGLFTGNAGAADSGTWRLEKDGSQFDPDADEYRREAADPANDRLANFVWRVDVGVTAAAHTWTLQAAKELAGDANWTASQRRVAVVRLSGAYEFAYSEDLTGISKNNATFEDVETVTFTPSTASLQWLIMGFFRGESGGANSHVHMRMPDSDLGAAEAQNEESVDADDNQGFHLNDVVALPASSQTINIQVAKTGGGPGIEADNAKVLAWGEPALIEEEPKEFSWRTAVGGGGV